MEGRLRTRNWDDDQGVRHYRTEVIANNIEFLDRRGEGGGGGDWGGGGGGSRGAAPSDVDDLPFE